MTRNRGSTQSQNGERAQSTVVAIVLIVAMVAIGGIGILLIGSSVNEEGQQRVQTQELRKSFVKLSKEIDSVARVRDDGVREIQLELPEKSDTAVQVDDVGHLWINKSSISSGRNTTLASQSLGAIRFTREDGTTLTYQTGGVWTETGERTRMVSPPSFVYRFNSEGRYPTLTLPLVVTDGERRLDAGTVTMRKTRSESPLSNISVVDGDLVKLTVKSDLYEGWAKYFRHLANSTNVPEDTSVVVDHQNQTVTLKMIVPTTRRAVSNAIVSGSEGSTLDISGDTLVDSYNSSTGPYTTGTDNGSVLLAGSLRMTNDGAAKPVIRGDVVVGENATLDGGSKVNGDLGYGGNKSIDPFSEVTGETYRIDSVRGYDAVGDLISFQAKRKDDRNDNDEVATIQSNRLACGDAASGGGGIDAPINLSKFDYSKYDEIDIDLKYPNDTEADVDIDRSSTGRYSGPPTIKLDIDIDQHSAEVKVDFDGGDDDSGDDSGDGGDLWSSYEGSFYLSPGSGDHEETYTYSTGTKDWSESSYPSWVWESETAIGYKTVGIGSFTPDTIPCVLPSGDYYLDRLELNQTLRLNTSGGPINLVVDGRATIDGHSAGINVTSTNHRADVYVNSEQVGYDFRLDGTISVPNDNATQFWLYMKPEADARLDAGSQMAGVFFGPGGNASAGATLELRDGTDLYGAAVADVETTSGDIGIHYDTALQNQETIKRDTIVPSKTFIHASVYEVCVHEADDAGSC